MSFLRSAFCVHRSTFQTLMRFYLRSISYFKEDAGKIALSLLVIGAMAACGLLQFYPFRFLVDNIFGPLRPGGGIAGLFFHYAPAGKVGQVVAQIGRASGRRREDESGVGG